MLHLKLRKDRIFRVRNWLIYDGNLLHKKQYFMCNNDLQTEDDVKEKASNQLMMLTKSYCI